MAVQAQDLQKDAGGTFASSLPRFAVGPSLRLEQSCQTLFHSLALKGQSPSQHPEEEKHLSLQLQDHDSFSSPSTSEQQQEMINFQDQCITSESALVQNESRTADMQGLPRSTFFVSNSDFFSHPSQTEATHSTNGVPYSYPDPSFSSFLYAYGPQALVQPQMMATAPGRVALPLDLAEEGPIFVNAKQYRGILRRRQVRAKLEAQNKLVKNRKPYLHESRHLHAMNRVRGSGGRFLSSKKSQQSNPTPPSFSYSSSDTVQFHQVQNIVPAKRHHSNAAKEATNGNAIFHKSHEGMSSTSSYVPISMQGKNKPCLQWNSALSSGSPVRNQLR